MDSHLAGRLDFGTTLPVDHKLGFLQVKTFTKHRQKLIKSYHSSVEPVRLVPCSAHKPTPQLLWKQVLILSVDPDMDIAQSAGIIVAIPCFFTFISVNLRTFAQSKLHCCLTNFLTADHFT